MTTNLPNDYPALLGEIKQRIRAAQYEALKAVNKELIGIGGQAFLIGVI